MDGFAYVGTGPTYTIYNCKNGTWTSSGLTVNQSPIGNEDDIDQDPNGKLQFADRVYDSQNPNGMGYVILRKNKTFAEQVTQENTIYDIRYAFDLDGASVTIPAGCVLHFDGGVLMNGTISFNSTILQSEHFVGCSFSGTIKVDHDLHDYNFCDISAQTTNDMEFLAWLISQASENPHTLHLSRNYNIVIPRRRDDRLSLRRYGVEISGKTFSIDGGGFTIYDNTQYEKNQSYPFILAFDCHDIVIKDINFIGTNNSANSITDNPTSVDNAGSGGADFLALFGEVKNVSVSGLHVEHCHWGVGFGTSTNVSIDSEYHSSPINDNLTINGLVGCKVDVSAYDVSYGFMCCKGSNLDVSVYVEYCSRACYFAGVTNSKANVKGRFCHTPVLMYCKDAMSYTDDTYTQRVFTMCDNLDLSIEHLPLDNNVTQYPFSDIPLEVTTYGNGDSAIDLQFATRTNLYNSHIRAIITERDSVRPFYMQVAGRNVADTHNIELSGVFMGCLVLYGANVVTPSSVIVNMTLIDAVCQEFRSSLNNKSTIRFISSQFNRVSNNTQDYLPFVCLNSDLGSTSVKCSVLDMSIEDITNKIISSSERLLNPGQTSIYIIPSGEAGKTIYTDPQSLKIPVGSAKRIIFINPHDQRPQLFVNGFTMTTPGSQIQMKPYSFAEFIVFNVGGTYYSLFTRQDSSSLYQFGLATLSGGLAKGAIGYETTNGQLVYNYNGKVVNAFGRTAGVLKGTTASRPSLTSADAGYQYFDTDLGKYIFWNGSAWVNMDGSALS